MIWEMIIDDGSGNDVIYTALTRERLEKIRRDLKLPENVKVTIQLKSE